MEARNIDLQGKLIVFEGIDFTGKSTQVELLANYLRKNNLTVTTTHEPGGTALGEKLRKIILSRRNDELLPFSELLLLITSRAQLCSEIIEPALHMGHVVISSRYRFSSVAYQGYGRGIDLGLVEHLNNAATQNRAADITFLIDLQAELAVERKPKKHDRIEKEDLLFYRRVRQGYLKLAHNNPRVKIIDGAMSVERIARTVIDHLNQ
ncbi:dTMP kinase [Candidatus Bipolaricaulota bacterium]|nr:dTMP kinase [Candidatus Bipolaricaulota bacterium]